MVVLNTCCPFGKLKLDKGGLCDQPPVKTLSTEPLQASWLTALHTLLEGLSSSWTLQTCTWSVSPSLHPCAFSLCWFCLVSSHCNQPQTAMSTTVSWGLRVLPLNHQHWGVPSSLLAQTSLDVVVPHTEIRNAKGAAGLGEGAVISFTVSFLIYFPYCFIRVILN